MKKYILFLLMFFSTFIMAQTNKVAPAEENTETELKATNPQQPVNVFVSIRVGMGKNNKLYDVVSFTMPTYAFYQSDTNTKSNMLWTDIENFMIRNRFLPTNYYVLKEKKKIILSFITLPEIL